MYTERQIENWELKLKDAEPIKFKVDAEINCFSDILRRCMSKPYKPSGFDDNSTVKLDGKYQCDRNRCRSAQDLYLLTKFYKSDVTFTQINSLLEKVKKLSNDYLDCDFCSTVQRIVYWTYDDNMSKVMQVIKENNLDIQFNE